MAHYQCPGCGEVFADGKSKTAIERAAKHAMHTPHGPDTYNGAQKFVEPVGNADGTDEEPRDNPGGSGDGAGAADAPIYDAPDVEETSTVEQCPECGADTVETAAGHRFEAIGETGTTVAETEAGDRYCGECETIVGADGTIYREVRVA